MFDLAIFDIAELQTSAAAARLLRALGNERRLMILCQLAEGVVATRRDAQTIWRRLADPAAMKVVATLAEIFCPPRTGKA